MASMEVLSDQNVMYRVASLPLVSSAYDIMSNVYVQTKDQHPYLKTVCEVAEMGMKTVTSLAISSALPIIDKLEPQLIIANGLACKGLDKIEKNLPILHQPSEQVMASAKGAVSGAKEVVAVTMSGARETVSSAVSDVVVRTRGAVQGGVSTVTDSRVVRLVSSGVSTAISTSENLVEQYLPHTHLDTTRAARAVEGFEGEREAGSYYVRLGSLSTKLRERAYQRAVAKVRDTRQRSQESIAQLHLTMDVIEYAKKNIGDANQKMQDKLRTLVDWKQNADTPETSDAECIESRTLALARGLSQQLQTTCQGLATSAQGLPQHIQDQVLTVTHSAAQVYASFSQAVAFGDLSDSVLTSSRAQLHRLREGLDHAMDYLVNNTPLNWLVGPFYPHMEGQAPPGGRAGKCSSSEGGGADGDGNGHAARGARLSLPAGPSHPHDAQCVPASACPPANGNHPQSDPQSDRHPDALPGPVAQMGVTRDVKARKPVKNKQQ